MASMPQQQHHPVLNKTKKSTCETKTKRTILHSKEKKKKKTEENKENQPVWHRGQVVQQPHA